MPRLQSLRTLTVARASQSGRPRHLSAASGLVAAGRYLYVIADDELHLGMFRARGRDPGTLVELHPGDLPLSRKERKRRKPDFESIVALPRFAGFPAGALLALGSGSRPKRRKGALIALDARGALTGAPRVVDLSPMYAAIEPEFDEINIEGAFVDGNRLSLLQRGNKGDVSNARIRVALPAVLDALSAGEPLPRAALIDITPFGLGTIAGVPLCFTDGAALGGGAFAFTAVAEDTEGSYADGACAGSAIGVVDRHDCVRALWRLEPSLKVEGIAARILRNALELTVVTDADDFTIAARLLRCRLR
jgi:hypothetical protein